MLFLLTGDVQIGKTRWLERLCADLSARGVYVAGVLAPGVWCPISADDVQGKSSGCARFEKQGIDNVLLPEGERIAFARRRDLALAEGALDEHSQSESAQLVWHISDEALARVNAHFAHIAHTVHVTHTDHITHTDRIAHTDRITRSAHIARTDRIIQTASVPCTTYISHVANRDDAHEAISEKSPLVTAAKMPSEVEEIVSRETISTGSTCDMETNVSRETFLPHSVSGNTSNNVSHSVSRDASSAHSGLLVVDEVGRLELERGGGLTEAVALLQAGPSECFPHALVVVRNTLLACACKQFAHAWEDCAVIAPDASGRDVVFTWVIGE